MKIKAFILLTLFCALTVISCSEDDDPGVIIIEEELIARIPCENGFADIYPCDNYDLVSRLSVDDLSATANNDIWGWTDPSNGNEYALVGTRQGTVFVNISQADEPIITGTLLTATDDSVWRDIKVFNDHAFIVSEADGHGMQIFDLTRLRDVTTAPEVFDVDAQYNEFGNAHNLVINEDTGYAYAVGTSTFLGGPHFVNIQNPLNPIFEGGFEFAGYTHDAQVVIYNGPDIDYQGQEMFIGSNEDEIVVVDVTDKANPILVSTTVYPNIGFTHQGWFSEDQTYFYANDELDESNFGFESRTLIFDFTDLDNPFFASPFFGPNQAIDHNLYVNGNEVFLSNYTAGMRVADITNRTAPFDIGFFDTFPENDNTSFDGVWSIYPYFPSGNIIINDLSQGLFIVRRSGT